MSHDVQTAGNEEKQAPLFYFWQAEVDSMAMNEHETGTLVSILMESPLYMTLSLKERKALLERLAESYPTFEGGPNEQDSDHK